MRVDHHELVRPELERLSALEAKLAEVGAEFRRLDGQRAATGDLVGQLLAGDESAVLSGIEAAAKRQAATSEKAAKVKALCDVYARAVEQQQQRLQAARERAVGQILGEALDGHRALLGEAVATFEAALEKYDAFVAESARLRRVAGVGHLPAPYREYALPEPMTAQFRSRLKEFAGMVAGYAGGGK